MLEGALIFLFLVAAVALLSMAWFYYHGQRTGKKAPLLTYISLGATAAFCLLFIGGVINLKNAPARTPEQNVRTFVMQAAQDNMDKSMDPEWSDLDGWSIQNPSQDTYTANTNVSVMNQSGIRQNVAVYALVYYDREDNEWHCNSLTIGGIAVF